MGIVLRSLPFWFAAVALGAVALGVTAAVVVLRDDDEHLDHDSELLLASLFDGGIPIRNPKAATVKSEGFITGVSWFDERVDDHDQGVVADRKHDVVAYKFDTKANAHRLSTVVYTSAGDPAWNLGRFVYQDNWLVLLGGGFTLDETREYERLLRGWVRSQRTPVSHDANALHLRGGDTSVSGYRQWVKDGVAAGGCSSLMNLTVSELTQAQTHAAAGTVEWPVTELPVDVDSQTRAFAIVREECAESSAAPGSPTPG
jgi:hypothetical protein